MKYIRLSKEQLDELNFEFARFLAAQQIDANQWKRLKKENPKIVEDEIDVFSDMVWEKSLSRVQFLERFEKQSLSFIKINSNGMSLRSVVVNNPDIDMTTSEGMQWVSENFFSHQVQFYKGEKCFSEERNTEIFRLILQNYHISDGTYYQKFETIL